MEIYSCYLTVLAVLCQTCIFWNTIPSVGATCNDEQVQRCRQAASNKKLQHLPAGGQCTEQQYVHYTHECVVNNYAPDVDSCCCIVEDKVRHDNDKLMCCRYHQDWNRFRCSLAEDTIEIGNISSSSLPSLKIMLSAILTSAFLAIIILFCCTYFWRKRCKANKNNKKKKKVAQIYKRTNRTPPERAPLAGTQPEKSIDMPPDDPTSVPSAPPLEENENNYPDAPYHIAGTTVPLMGYQQPGCEGHDASLPGAGHCPTCSSSVAPPAYDESHQHQRLT